MATGTVSRHRGDTRGAIQRAALTRFTEQGYDQTSLREIAEDLGVTKAALYYHFRTKEEIFASLLGEVATRLEEILAWAQTQPPTRATRLEIIDRLGAATQGGTGELLRCAQQNELALGALPGAAELVHRFKSDLSQAAMPPDASLEDALRVRLAIMAVLLATKSGTDLGGTSAQRLTAALRVAGDLMP